MKKCLECGKKQPLTAFYKHYKNFDGYFHRCKNCVKPSNTANRKKRAGYYKEFDRLRANLPELLDEGWDEDL